MCDETARAMQFVKKVGMAKDLFMGMTINDDKPMGNI